MRGVILSVKNSVDLVKNMGWRYTSFRIKYEFLKRSGLLKKQFPQSPRLKQYLSLNEWKEKAGNFFFDSKETLSCENNPSLALKEWFDNYAAGKFLFFNSTIFNIGKNYIWVTNPDTGYVYDVKKHWTEISDFTTEAGDIKYVWEKSRFCFLYNIIRYDYHFNKDCAPIVFDEILSWIEDNPVNSGPNYVCSQEISLRILNWIFALYYYRNSPHLTEKVFSKIQYAVYWQWHHVYKNICFSRIAVRNNHTITETLALYVVGLLFPIFPNAAEWKEKGKHWFEQEIARQIYEDGTYLQFSMNYHRVVVQLLTWAIALAEKNNERFNPAVYERAKRSLQFLRICMNDSNGWLPNYGANDGALFFPFNDTHFRDYRPQLQALANILNINIGIDQKYEDTYWYNIQPSSQAEEKIIDGLYEFRTGGYYIIREKDSLSFIRCGKHRDRPSQADNLHLDIWHKGFNVLTDAGSYKYNTDEKNLRYFAGTSSHNTVMLNGYDQMLKGQKFIWHYWSQCLDVKLYEVQSEYRFEGTVSAFQYVGKNIFHKREVIKQKGQPFWTIKDTIINKPASTVMKQLWHLPKDHMPVSFKSIDEKNNVHAGEEETAYTSNLYGQKEISEVKIFLSRESTILTEFQING